METNKTISVLYTREKSIYNQLGTDNWDIKKDARKWPGGNPIIAHPPCRGWGNYRHLAKTRNGEHALAIHAIIMIRLWGGILEHPQGSKIWKQLPKPGQYDQYGGFTISINQSWFGHRATKKTMLYMVGTQYNAITYPISLDCTTNTIENMGKAERERTPIEFAKWLINITKSLNKQKLLQCHTSKN